MRPNHLLQVLTVIVLSVIISGCKTPSPVGPTLIPSPSITFTLEPSLTPALSYTPLPTFVQIISATPVAGPTSVPVLQAPTATAKGPTCFIVQPGDTLVKLAQKAGYRDLGILDVIRQDNNIEGNNISVGQNICVRQPSPTPTPTNYEKTLTAVPSIFQTFATRVMAFATYVIVAGDDITGIVFKTGVSLRVLCELNNPDPLNCGGCNLDAAPGQYGCRPIVVKGKSLRIPGPTQTPSITPTLTGSETATSTPAYDAPNLVSPVMDATVTGTVQLTWLPTSGLLKPDEFYLVVWTDINSGQTLEPTTTATSLRLPAEMEPHDGQPHRINWRVSVARQTADGNFLQISPPSVIYSFDWQSR